MVNPDYYRRQHSEGARRVLHFAEGCQGRGQEEEARGGGGGREEGRLRKEELLVGRQRVSERWPVWLGLLISPGLCDFVE